jgi:hypothetical protein
MGGILGVVNCPGLAVFGHALDSEGVGILFDEWQGLGRFAFSGHSGLKMLYPLSEGSGEIAYDQSGNDIHLQIPSKMQILKKEVLARTWHLGESTSHFLMDIFLNYFLPLDFCWPLSWKRAGASENTIGRWRFYYASDSVCLLRFGCRRVIHTPWGVAVCFGPAGHHRQRFVNVANTALQTFDGMPGKFKKRLQHMVTSA